MANRHTIFGELIAKQDGQYSQFVFKNLEEPLESWGHYVMVTKCPNWNYKGDLSIGDTGFLTFEPVEAGESYYDSGKEQIDTYKYTSCYFINFVKIQEKDNNQKEFKF